MEGSSEETLTEREIEGENRRGRQIDGITEEVKFCQLRGDSGRIGRPGVLLYIESR